jgi:hypothetical protein
MDESETASVTAWDKVGSQVNKARIIGYVDGVYHSHLCYKCHTYWDESEIVWRDELDLKPCCIECFDEYQKEK